MQIILLEKVANVGDLGDVVKVKNGFARNFLIPQGKAKRATPENLKMLEAQARGARSSASAEARRSAGAGREARRHDVKITQKAGVDGRLFGSVTNADIVEALKAQGFTVEKAMMRMPEGPLKHIGEFPITVALHTRCRRAHHVSPWSARTRRSRNAVAAPRGVRRSAAWYAWRREPVVQRSAARLLHGARCCVGTHRGAE